MKHTYLINNYLNKNMTSNFKNNSKLIISDALIEMTTFY